MWELRWVLLGLGALVILAVYAWGRGYFKALASRAQSGKAKPARLEPKVGDEVLIDEVPETPADEAEASDTEPERRSGTELEVDRVITLRFIPADQKWGGDRVILALRAAGLRHGRYGIFHKHASALDDAPLFSVANLTEPGSFDLTRLSETTIPGMSFFMVLPGAGDPVERFDLMIETARSLARELDADLHDEKGSSWSIQRERYIREEIIAYRHQRELNSES